MSERSEGRGGVTTPVPSTRGPGDLRDPMAEIVDRVRRITRENERLFQQLIEGERRFRRLAKAVWKVQEEERRRLARELHDGIGQTLTALKNQLERLERRPEPVNARPDLAGAVELAARALQETRELSRLLRPPVLDDLGLVPALRWLGRTLTQGSDLAVEVAAAGVDDRLDADLETLIFRVVQEGLTNALKHAEAREARVELRRDGGRISLTVSDRGRGFEADRVLAAADAPGCGLRGMRDRVELFGGRFEIHSRPGAGTRLEVEVPLADGGQEGAR